MRLLDLDSLVKMCYDAYGWRKVLSTLIKRFGMFSCSLFCSDYVS